MKLIKIASDVQFMHSNPYVIFKESSSGVKKPAPV